MQTPAAAPWLDYAWPDLGVTEVPGPGSSDRVRAYFACAGHPEIISDEVAWCAAFVGACLERAGVRCTRSLQARSYLAFGVPIDKAVAGCVAIFSRGTNPSDGHVAFVVGATVDAMLVLGGNQSDSVSVTAIPRARLLGLRWPLLAADRGRDEHPISTDAIMDAPFEFALQHVLNMEGGYTDDPYDPGGATNLGITIADFAVFHGIPVSDGADLKAMVAALNPKDVAPIYRSLYWVPCRAPELPDPLALFHFDTAVNHGLGAAAHMLQRALNVDADGEIGPLTLAAVAGCEIVPTIDIYAQIRRDRYRALPTFWRFGRGWLARVDATSAVAQALTKSTSQHNNTRSPSMSSSVTQPTEQQPPKIQITPGDAKWWGQSVTIWGTIVTTLATVLPIVGPLVGISISADIVRELGDSVIHAAQAIGGVVGILMTVYGRTHAVQPLVRRNFLIKL